MTDSPLRFLVDIGVGKTVEAWLSANGYDVRTVRSLNPRAADMDILKVAASESRLVLTMDKDFGELVYKSKLAHTGVLILRIEDANGHEKAEVVRSVLEDHGSKIRGKFCVYQGGRLRISGQHDLNQHPGPHGGVS